MPEPSTPSTTERIRPSSDLLRTAKWWTTPGRLPRYIFRYPYNVLIVVRVYAMLVSICTLLMWHWTQKQFPHENTFFFVAVADLLSLLMVLMSAWFVVQKFYYVKLDAVLSLSSVVFILIALAASGSVSEDAETNDLFYFIFSHLYLLAAQLFSLGWALFSTHNSVSKLFIANWGQETTDIELELLEDDF